MEFDLYLEACILQLSCNSPEENRFITFDYTEKQLQDNLDYFKECFKKGLSPYKALSLFYFALNELKVYQ